ncbi:MAG: type VI secretion system tip protein TssI/VgrG [Polyangiaceae bacterium]
MGVTVLRLRGHEALSKAFTFELGLVRPDEDPRAWLGRRASLRMEVGGAGRELVGTVSRVRIGDAGGEIAVQFTSGLKLLEHRRTSRVFLALPAVEIARRVLQEHGLTVRAIVARPPANHEMALQYRETDLELVERVLAEEGYAYRVDAHLEPTGQHVERITIFDATEGYADIIGDRRLVYRSEGGAGATTLRRQEHHVARFVEDMGVSTERVLLREFDFGRPRAFPSAGVDLAGPAKVEPLKDLRALHEHQGPRSEMQAAPIPAEVVLDQMRRDARIFEGASETVRLAPGAVFQLDEHDDPTLNGEYAVVAIEHELRSEHHASSETSLYRNSFRAVRSDFTHRPPRPATRVYQTLETATVVGPEPDEVFTDELGRVRVRFHWDLADTKHGGDSTWIRVSQSWAGAGYGTQFVPRVGMEVIVSFLGGDPDRPIVTGCLPNATHPPAFALPGEQLVSGLRTRSSPDAGHRAGNVLSFDDKRGGEQIALLGERDVRVRATRHLETNAGANHNVNVGATYSVNVGAVYTTRVDGFSQLTTASGALNVAGSWSERIGGPYVAELSGGARCVVAGAYRSEVNGPRYDEVKGLWSARTDADFALTVGTGRAPARAEIQVRGAFLQRVDEKMSFHAGQELRLVCGDSQIVLTKDAIEIQSSKIKLSAKSIEMTGDGPSLRLTDRAEVSSDEVKIRGKKSLLTLDDAGIKLQGDAIQMAKGDGRETSESDKEDPEKNTLKIRFTDEYFHPYAGKHYELRAGEETIEGETDGEGRIVAKVSKEARLARVELWVDVYPKGKRREYTFVIEPLPSVSTLEGVRARLAQLGYLAGSNDSEELDEATMSALRAFQRDHGLEPTGQPDDATRGALVERHKS